MSLKPLLLAAASLTLSTISNHAAACDFGEVPCCPPSHPASCGSEQDLAIEANVALEASPETLERAFLVDVKLVLENGVVNSTSFTQDEIRHGITSKAVQLASISVVTKCSFTWIYQPQATDIKPRGMETSEEDIVCNYNAERNSFDISPKMSVKKLTISVVPSAFDSRGATNLVYGLQTHDASVPAADYPKSIKAVAINGALANDHFVFAAGELNFDLEARWLKAGNGTVAIDPVRNFSGEFYTVE